MTLVQRAEAARGVIRSSTAVCAGGLTPPPPGRWPGRPRDGPIRSGPSEPGDWAKRRQTAPARRTPGPSGGGARRRVVEWPVVEPDAELAEPWRRARQLGAGAQEATMIGRVCLKCSGLSYADWRR